jgi:hypothetical protein
LLSDDAANGNGSCGTQGNTQQTATGDETVTVFLTEKLQHGEVLRIGLNLVEKDQSVVRIAELVASHHAQVEIKRLGGMDVLEMLRTFIVFSEIDFHEIFEESSSYLSDNERFSDLSCTFQNQNLVRRRGQMSLNFLADFPVQHNQNTLFNNFSGCKYTLFNRNQGQKTTLFNKKSALKTTLFKKEAMFDDIFA